MTEFIVVANKLNLRSAPVNGDVLAVLDRGQALDDNGAPQDPAWLPVKATLMQSRTEVSGFVSSQYVEPLAAPAAAKPAARAGVAMPVFADLKKLAPQGKDAILSALVSNLAQAAAQFGILKSRLTLCHFLAQTAEESDGFRTTVEYASGREYEERKDLGNIHAGDGVRFKGRGIIQLTGRANYSIAGSKLNLPLLDNPALAADPAISVRTACYYWQSRDIEQVAATDDIRKVTRLINGGTRGLDTRTAYYNRARRLFP